MDFNLPEEIQCSSLKQGTSGPCTQWSLLLVYTCIVLIASEDVACIKFVTLFCLLPHLALFQKHLIHPLTISAKTKDGVQEAFEELVHKVLQTPSLYTTDSPSTSFSVGAGQEGGASGEGGWGCSCWVQVKYALNHTIFSCFLSKGSCIQIIMLFQRALLFTALLLWFC